MTNAELAEKLNFATLKDGMGKLGLDPDGVDDKEEAIKAIFDRFSMDEKLMEYECPNCGADLPEVEVCPFCGVDLTGGEAATPDEGTEDEDGGDDGDAAEGEDGKKAKRGRRKDTEPKGPSGDDLLRGLIRAGKFPDDMVHYRKSRTSLWCEGGLIAKCFPGKYSLRLNIPFPAEAFSDVVGGALVRDFKVAIKNMPACLTLKGADGNDEVLNVLEACAELKVSQEAEKQAKRDTKAAEKKKKADEKAAKAKEKKDAGEAAAKAAAAEKDPETTDGDAE